jgi:sugar lactone lactonase YvrE
MTQMNIMRFSSEVGIPIFALQQRKSEALLLRNSMALGSTGSGAERTAMSRKSLFASALLSMTVACGATGPANVAELTLPGNNYYPESLNIAADGSLFVGSLATGQVVKFAPGSTNAEVFVPTGTINAVAGVLTDNTGGALYICADDLSTQNPALPAVRSYRLADGTPLATYPFPSAGFCNDMAFDGQHNLYVTDSGGKIYKLPNGGTALSLWSSDPSLAPPTPQGFGADGIVWDGQSSLYVGTFNNNTLLRFPINADGSAGTPVNITVTPTLNAPDGIRLLNANTLLLVEGGAGNLTQVAINGNTATATVLQNGLNGPTSVAMFGGYGWVSEGQLGHFLGTISGPPSTPFLVRRFAIP